MWQGRLRTVYILNMDINLVSLALFSHQNDLRLYFQLPLDILLHPSTTHQHYLYKHCQEMISSIMSMCFFSTANVGHILN